MVCPCLLPSGLVPCCWQMQVQSVCLSLLLSSCQKLAGLHFAPMLSDVLQQLA